MDKKINFGCSSSGVDAWINVDNAMRHIIVSKIPFLPKLLYSLGFITKDVFNSHLNKKFKNVRYGDVRKRLKFESNSVDYIYSSNMLEHLFPEDAKRFLMECKRILKKNGVLRILIPDLEFQAKEYLLNLNDIDKKNKFIGNLYASQEYRGIKNGHKWMYDKYNLSNILKEIGFSEVIVGEYKSDIFPNASKLNILENSLIIEAEK